MKSNSFKRNNKSVFQVLQEDPKAKKKTNWDRIIYFVLASSILLFIIYAVVGRFLFIEADGHILFEKVKVQIPSDIRIKAFFYNEGDSVKRGDSLFTYTEKDISNYSVAANSNNSNWKMKELLSTQKNISLNNIEIIELDGLINKHKESLIQLKKEVTLDLIPKSKLEYFKKQITEHELKKQKLVEENSYLSSYLRKVKSTQFNTGSKGGVKNENDGLFQFNSPIDGTITRIHKEPYEVALKSEAVMTIHKNENIYIKGFFDQSDLRYLKVGDEVTVEFPDGTISEGVIGKFYFATYTLSAEFQKRYEPIQRTLGVDVYPLNDFELEKWKVFYKMGVKISKTKYW